LGTSKPDYAFKIYNINLVYNQCTRDDIARFRLIMHVGAIISAPVYSKGV